MTDGKKEKLNWPYELLKDHGAVFRAEASLRFQAAREIALLYASFDESGCPKFLSDEQIKRVDKEIEERMGEGK